MAVIAEPVAKPVSRFHFILDRREVLETILVAPAIIYVLLLVGLPLLLAVYYSLSAYTIYDPTWKFVGLANFAQILQNPTFIDTLRQHLHLYVRLATARPRARKVRRLPAAAAVPRPQDRAGADHPAFRGAGRARHDRLAMDVQFALQRDQLDVDRGSASSIARDAPNWLGNPYLAMLCVIIINAWRFFPFAIVIFLAGITAVPQDVIDAATVDGAGFWRRNYQIILPMILPIMAIGLIFGIVFTFTDLSIVFLLTMGGPGRRDLGAGFCGLSDRHRFRRRVAWRGHLAVHAAGAAGRRDLHAALHSPPGDLTCRALSPARSARLAFFVGVAFFVILAAFPFYWMVITAFKQNSDLYDVTNIPFWFNEPPTLEHIKYLFEETLFARWLLNSLIIGVCVIAITLVTAVPAGYAWRA